MYSYVYMYIKLILFLCRMYIIYVFYVYVFNAVECQHRPPSLFYTSADKLSISPQFRRDTEVKNSINGIGKFLLAEIFSVFSGH